VRLRPEALRRYRTADEAFMRRSPGEGASSWRERLDEAGPADGAGGLERVAVYALPHGGVRRPFRAGGSPPVASPAQAGMWGNCSQLPHMPKNPKRHGG
jgi:hypothetical protein